MAPAAAAAIEESGRVCSGCNRRLNHEHYSNKQWQAKAKVRKCLKCTSTHNGNETTKSHGGIEVVTVEPYGRVLRTTAAVKKGDVIWQEEPIVHSARVADLTRREEVFVSVLSSKLNGLSVIEDFLFIKAYVALPLRDRNTVLDCYYPTKAEVSRSPLLSALIKICPPIFEELFKGSDGALRNWTGAPVNDSDELEKVVLIKATNAHAYYVQSEVTACALYELGSKMRHSCAPNVVYSSRRGSGGSSVESSQGSFVALIDLPANTELRFSYIEPVAPACMRRQLLLNNYVFYCDCPLCESIDYYRGIPCPKCSPRRGDWVEAAETKLIHPDDLKMPQVLSQGTIYHVDKEDYQWVCNVCGAKVSEDECGLPEDLEDSLIDTARNCDDLDEYELSQHLRSMPLILGVNHSAVWLVRKAYINRLIENNGALERIKNETAQLLAAVDHAGELFEKELGPHYYIESGAAFMESLLNKVAGRLTRDRQWELAEEYLQKSKASMLLLMAPNDDPIVTIDKALAACQLGDVSMLPQVFRG
ncbi:hypothetical protein FOL47_009885 [Perkinsus chesapeaki]|uniref:SET domain-containing protein n=1 Tax=Perkinsus chesapeaki TaxID=330153 RepID=A0A7J6MRJ8_PERCH|nr:hypothetical protein FOL47_009885 [Perkinsus chesapeaki]